MLPADFDPKNYESQWDPTSPKSKYGGLVCDEREWLARPAFWGIDELSPIAASRKWLLLDVHVLRFHVETYLSCPSCKQKMLKFCEQLEARVEDRLVVNDFRRDTRSGLCWQKGEGLAEGACGCHSYEISRFMRQYQRGAMTQMELMVRVFEIRRHELVGANPFQDFRQARSDFTELLSVELCGPNPFQPIALDPKWKTETAIGLASLMYDTRDFNALPILADALQDAGCEEETILRHCREPGHHVRGCWVVDLVLGKQ